MFDDMDAEEMPEFNAAETMRETVKLVYVLVSRCSTIDEALAALDMYLKKV